MELWSISSRCVGGSRERVPRIAIATRSTLGGRFVPFETLPLPLHHLYRTRLRKLRRSRHVWQIRINSWRLCDFRFWNPKKQARSGSGHHLHVSSGSRVTLLLFLQPVNLIVHIRCIAHLLPEISLWLP